MPKTHGLIRHDASPPALLKVQLANILCCPTIDGRVSKAAGSVGGSTHHQPCVPSLSQSQTAVWGSKLSGQGWGLLAHQGPGLFVQVRMRAALSPRLVRPFCWASFQHTQDDDCPYRGMEHDPVAHSGSTILVSSFITQETRRVSE